MTDANVTPEDLANRIEKARQEEVECAELMAAWFVADPKISRAALPLGRQIVAELAPEFMKQMHVRVLAMIEELDDLRVYLEVAMEHPDVVKGAVMASAKVGAAKCETSE